MDHFDVLNLALKSYKKFANTAKNPDHLSCLFPQTDTCQFLQILKTFWLECP